jgi:hypothetical protein
MLGIVGRVTVAVMDYDFGEIEWRYALETGDIDAELIRVRPALVVRVNAASVTEMVLGDTGIEAIGRELVLALGDFEILRR